MLYHVSLALDLRQKAQSVIKCMLIYIVIII